MKVELIIPIARLRGKLNGKSPFCTSNIVHCPSSFVHKLSILHCSFVHFFGDFSVFSCIFAKKVVPLQPQRFARRRRARMDAV